MRAFDGALRNPDAFFYGIGLKTAATLHQKFKIASLNDLKKFVAGGGLEMVDGIGEKSIERITESLTRL